LSDLVANSKSVDVNGTETQFLVPYQQNPRFTGRGTFLETLKSRLSQEIPNGYSHRVALWGMGGIGKTQIALEYVYIYRAYYDRIFWISAIDQGSLLSGFQKVAVALAIPSRAGSRLQEIADDVLKQLQGAQKWLIVFDNVDNAELVKGLLPENGPQKHTLITTKNLHTHGIPADPLEVPLLDCQDCVKLISTLSNIHIAPDSPEHKEAERIAFNEQMYDPTEVVERLRQLPFWPNE